MNYLTLAELKRQVAREDTLDDDLLTDLGNAAEATIETIICQPLAGLLGDGCVFPSPLRHAARLLVAQWYQNREGVVYTSLTQTPFAVSCLLAPWVRPLGEEEAWMPDGYTPEEALHPEDPEDPEI